MNFSDMNANELAILAHISQDAEDYLRAKYKPFFVDAILHKAELDIETDRIKDRRPIWLAWSIYTLSGNWIQDTTHADTLKDAEDYFSSLKHRDVWSIQRIDEIPNLMSQIKGGSSRGRILSLIHI